MPTEKRDPNSHARLFIPTTTEKSFLSGTRKLKKELEDVSKLKEELLDILAQAKKGTQD